jgi:HK97 gp10 family phage protein
MSVTITGVRELQRMLQRGEKAPAKVLTKATKDGANIARTQAKIDSPKKYGALRRGIKLKAEKRRTGKKVYRIQFIGDGFVKQKGERSNLKTRKTSAAYRAFYPASQEYGWKKPSGGRAKEPKHKGFMKNAIQNNREKIKNTVID